MTFNEETGVLTMNEYEVHDLIGALNGLCGLEVIEHSNIVETIKIVPEDADIFGPELVQKWEQKLQALLEMFGTYDRDWHDDAEHTC